jgi:hypothetical protein
LASEAKRHPNCDDDLDYDADATALDVAVFRVARCSEKAGG